MSDWKAVEASFQLKVGSSAAVTTKKEVLLLFTLVHDSRARLAVSIRI